MNRPGFSRGRGRGRGRGRPDRRSQGWSSVNVNRIRPPPGLTGRDLGMYYRNLSKTGKKPKKENIIKLVIPPVVSTKLLNNIQEILSIAKEQNIHIPQLKKTIFPERKHEIDTSSIKNEMQCDKSELTADSEKDEKPIFSEKKPDESILKSDFIPLSDPDVKPSTSSSTSYFITSNTGQPSKYDINEKILNLRAAGDYKYSYYDIITGSFDEKLEECLSKGIPINKKTEEIEHLNAKYYNEYKTMINSAPYKNMKKFRETLPTYKKSKELLDIISSNQVIVISGETGCGKSTQVPQIILDDAICKNRGANVKILVTQPRRIAASSLAMRVAEERGESLGKSVGYAVRLERVDERGRGSIMFCTTGILLADLEVNQGLTDYSHVILDEVHERDCHIDLSMCMLKQVLKRRKDLTLILMSATIDAERLTAYFDNCPMMHIEGLAYPVQDFYLEHVLDITKYRLPEDRQKNFGEKKWHKYKKSISNAEMEKDIQYRAEIGDWLESIKRGLDPMVYETLKDRRIEDIHIDLIHDLVVYISKQEPGAVLVFLPGINDITKLLKMMDERKQFPQSRFSIYPLHSKLPTLDQHKIFQRPPPNVRKIIIATNIAETSITIDDVVYVVDCGKMKCTGLNVEENISTLRIEWVSQANLRQRRGRAGRCQPGICYHLVSSYRASVLAERVLPELQRSNLLEPVLMIKKLRLGMAADALKMVPGPPAETTVQWAVKHLQQCGALDAEETLTPLGWHLARLPVHPAAGKLLLLGSLFGCLDRAASVAAVWGFKDPFMLVIGKEAEVDEAKRHLTLGEPSDHVAISEAIIHWEQCRTEHERRSFTFEYFLSSNTIKLLSEMKSQLGNSLREMGFLPSGSVTSTWENRNSNNLSLFKAVIAAALYPNIANVRWAHLNSRKRLPSVKAYTPEDGRIMIHPSSAMSLPKPRNGRMVSRPLCDNPGANWLVYWLKQRSSDLFLIEVTLVYTLPLLFFGELKVSEAEDDPDDCYISITTVKVRCKKAQADLLFQLRSLLDYVLACKVSTDQNNSRQYNQFEHKVLDAVIAVITAEDEGAEYMGGDDSESEHSEYESNTSQNRPNRRY